MGSRCRLKDEWLDPTKTFAFPLWAQVHDWMKASFPETGYYRAYTELAVDWVERIVARFPVAMTVGESENFVVGIPAARRLSPYLQQLENYRAQIFQALEGPDLFQWGSKSVVIVAPDNDTFLLYLSDYHGPGKFMMPGGVCLRHGYIHFVLPDHELTLALPVLAHELCHVCVTGIPWPEWVEEGVVQTVEHKVSQRNPYVLDHDIIRRHQRYWTPEKLEKFWTGESFHSPDEGSQLSYHLARFLVEAAAQHGRGPFLQFLRTAKLEDSGFAALREAIGVSPVELAGNLFGWKSQAAPRHLRF